MKVTVEFELSAPIACRGSGAYSGSGRTQAFTATAVHAEAVHGHGVSVHYRGKKGTRWVSGFFRSNDPALGGARRLAGGAK